MKKIYTIAMPQLPSKEEGEEWNSLCDLIRLQGNQYPEIAKSSVSLQVVMYGEAERYTAFNSLLMVIKAYFAAQVLSVDTCFKETSCKIIKTNGGKKAVVKLTAYSQRGK